MVYEVNPTNDSTKFVAARPFKPTTKGAGYSFGMKIPPNYGTAYSKAFETNYKTVSQKYQVKLLPFFLDGVAGQNN